MCTTFKKMDAGIWATRLNGRGGYVLGERSIEHEEGMNIGTQRDQRFQFEERRIGTRGTPCCLYLLYTSSRTYRFVKTFFRAHPCPSPSFGDFRAKNGDIV